jgi:replication factor C subunit 3/5
MSLTDNYLPWIEKYRPTNFDEIVSHKLLVKTLKRTIKKNKLQHLLFHGPSGSGKTSLIMACARELYGDSIDLMTLNINASEERGIEIVRNRIHQFVTKTNVFSNNNSLFKLVILDEADSMTHDAQAMLRQVIEKYSYCTRFCLICNYIQKITLALQSRCACYRFSPLEPEYIKKQINYICKKENIQITPDGTNTLINRSNGDLRRIINILQSTNMSYNVINEYNINKCIGYPNLKIIQKIFKSLMNDNFYDSYKLINNIIIKNAYSLQDIITEITQIIIILCKNSNKDKYKLLRYLCEISEIEKNLSTCTLDNIQISGFISIFKKKV